MNFLTRIRSAQAIGIKNGKARALKGKHTGRLLSEISSTCSLNAVESGEIWIDSRGRITFSRNIPVEKHQQFRNTINNSGS